MISTIVSLGYSKERTYELIYECKEDKKQKEETSDVWDMESNTIDFYPIGGFFLDLLRFNSNGEIEKFLDKTRQLVQDTINWAQCNNQSEVAIAEAKDKLLNVVARTIKLHFTGSLLSPILFTECVNLVNRSWDKSDCWEQCVKEISSFTEYVRQYLEKIFDFKTEPNTELLQQIFKTDKNYENGDQPEAFAKYGQSIEFFMGYMADCDKFFTPFLFESLTALIAFDIYNYQIKEHFAIEKCTNCGHYYLCKKYDPRETAHYCDYPYLLDVPENRNPKSKAKRQRRTCKKCGFEYQKWRSGEKAKAFVTLKKRFDKRASRKDDISGKAQILATFEKLSESKAKEFLDEEKRLYRQDKKLWLNTDWLKEWQED